jgi:hypothetical protein
MYERVKSIILLAKTTTGASDKLTPVQSFIVGALSKTLATIVSLYNCIIRSQTNIYHIRLRIHTLWPRSAFRLGAPTRKKLKKNTALLRSRIHPITINSSRSIPVRFKFLLECGLGKGSLAGIGFVLSFCLLRDIHTLQFTGNECANHKSCLIAGTAFHVERSVRALCPGYHGVHCSFLYVIKGRALLLFCCRGL